MMNRDLVSIITPTYNSEKFLIETIKCVLNQTYSNWEWLITDDASKDKTVEILKKYSAVDNRIKVFLLKNNMGSGFARNNSIKKSKGKYIAFIDSDDLWEDNKLEIQINFMNKNNISFSHTSYGYINENGNKIKKTFNVSKLPVGYEDLLKRTEISCLTAIYDSSKIGKFYMSNHRRKQDYALWLKILKHGYYSFPIPSELAYYRQYAESATSNKLPLLFKHASFLKETQKMNWFLAIYYTMYWAINGFVRYYLK